MATAANIAEVANVLECPICMDTFDNPKLLSCAHQFCKCCLDELLEFNADGGGRLVCPNRCQQETFIAANETTNDLRTSYEFKALLEILTPKNETTHVPAAITCSSENCKKDVSVYCCGEFRCRSCDITHRKNQQVHERKLDVVFDRRDNNLKVLCQQHATGCSYLCSDNDFICPYCSNRSHSNHARHAVEEEACNIRGVLDNDAANMHHINEVRRVTEEAQLQSKFYLDRALLERKMQCLASYLVFLNNEEGTIKENYQRVLDEHQAEYPSPIATDYFQNNLQKQDLQLVIEKNSIIRTLGQHNLSNTGVRHVNVSLSEDFGINNTHPLGELQVSHEEERLFCNVSAATFNFYDNEHKNMENTLSNLAEELKNLKAIVTKYERKEDGETANTVHVTEGLLNVTTESLDQPGRPADVRKRTSLPNNENISHPRRDSNKKIELTIKEAEMLNNYNAQLDKEDLNYAEHLIKSRDNEELTFLLEERTNIVNMKYRDDVTPLHLATQCNNLEAVQLLIEHGASVDAKTGGGETVLHWAVWNDSDECMLWLVQHYPMLIDMKQDNGWTPLHVAACNGKLSCLKTLLQHGADHHGTECSGRTPLQIAIAFDRHACDAELQKSTSAISEQL